MAAARLSAIYHMLRDGTVYKDRGAGHFNHAPESRAYRLAKQIEKLGFRCDIAPLQTAEPVSI